MGVCPSSHKEGTRGCPQDAGAVTGLTEQGHTGRSTQPRKAPCTRLLANSKVQKQVFTYFLQQSSYALVSSTWALLQQRRVVEVLRALCVRVLSPHPACLQCAWPQTATGSILSTHGTREQTSSIRLNSRNKISASQRRQCGTKPTQGKGKAGSSRGFGNHLKPESIKLSSL